jgi:hypothetical protein
MRSWPPTAAIRAGHVGQPGSGAGAGAGEAGAVVGDLADQLAGVVAQGDGDAGVVAGVLGGVLQRFQAAMVSSEAWPGSNGPPA